MTLVVSLSSEGKNGLVGVSSAYLQKLVNIPMSIPFKDKVVCSKFENKKQAPFKQYRCENDLKKL